ncbi:MAG TPA: type I DNA topoisomerase [Nocardioidaceae bacterium]|nr:type I DNA topoisomerase [Nocardioidaceae bacterium]
MATKTTGERAGAGLRLVIVESPAKARTIAGYLGDDYVVESSIGHIRDLPNNAAEVPAKYKSLPWARLGVDVANGFAPLYVVPKDKKPQITRLKSLLRDASELYLATDEDREGEAIAWHLLDELKPTVPVRRMVFHEITAAAIAAAVANPREIDAHLVDAQETRRILDRLYGYEVSPVLWKKVMSGLSAGRVQSVATRLVVDRERERIAFRAAGYWDLEATFDGGQAAEPPTFPARLASVDGAKVAQGRDFAATGELRAGSDVVHLDESGAHALVAALRDQPFRVSSVDAKPYRRSPYAPFRTTTLQQEASRKLGFGAARTMQVAQRLYENGHITYMRTDSVTLSESAVAAARTQVRELYGAEYVPSAPRLYTSKVKSAQEAHEAIRPAGDEFATPASTGLQGEQLRLYELIWKRTVASQMKDAEGHTVTVRVAARAQTGQDVVFTSSGRVITFHGFLRAYVEGADDPEAMTDDRETRLPALSEGDSLSLAALTAAGHETRPPARYTEATLVRELEEREIGRPSTYAAILGTILGRGYVYKKGTALVPAWLAFAVVRLLERHFERIVDYAFTAQLEDVLDDIAAGRRVSAEVLDRFWFGAEGLAGLESLVAKLGDIDARELSTFDLGEGVAVRVGRYGPYVEDSAENRANVPEDLPPDELTLHRARELLAEPTGAERVLGTDPATGRPVVAKNGRYGPYVTELLDDDAPKGTKARTSSLFKTMSLETLSLDDALALLSLPRVLGTDPDSGAEVSAANGRYGPYVKRDSDYRSLESEEQLFTITLDEALALLREPKARGRRTPAAPLRELGEDPATGAPMVIKSGRFGPYVTDGQVNATLRQGDDPQTVTPQRAAELLADKREKGPATKPVRTKKKAATKKAATKKPTAAKTNRTAKSGGATASVTTKRVRKRAASKSVAARAGAAPAS